MQGSKGTSIVLFDGRGFKIILLIEYEQRIRETNPGLEDLSDKKDEDDDREDGEEEESDNFHLSLMKLTNSLLGKAQPQNQEIGEEEDGETTRRY